MGIGAHAVSSAGDVNGDGIDDVLFGADAADPGGVLSRGEAYLLYGATSFAPIIDLATLDGSNGIRIPGLSQGDFVGRSVAGLGDVNGDGIDDFAVGAHAADAPARDSGAQYIIYGGAGLPATFDLSTLDGTNGFKISGIDPSDLIGATVNATGDLNNDGLQDIAIGSQVAGTGEGYVVYGSTTAPANLSLADLDGSNGFAVTGVNSGDEAGRFISGAGDFNGDGIDDLLVGAHAADPNGINRAGEVYVIFGGQPFGPDFDLATIDPGSGVRIQGDTADDEFGFNLQGAGTSMATALTTSSPVPSAAIPTENPMRARLM